MTKAASRVLNVAVAAAGLFGDDRSVVEAPPACASVS